MIYELDGMQWSYERERSVVGTLHTYPHADRKDRHNTKHWQHGNGEELKFHYSDGFGCEFEEEFQNRLMFMEWMERNWAML